MPPLLAQEGNRLAIQMHIAEQGKGPLVILRHGFPETWFSWRHQIGPIADFGWHVVAPDQRGYGGTTRGFRLFLHSILRPGKRTSRSKRRWEAPADDRLAV